MCWMEMWWQQAQAHVCPPTTAQCDLWIILNSASFRKIFCILPPVLQSTFTGFFLCGTVMWAHTPHQHSSTLMKPNGNFGWTRADFCLGNKLNNRHSFLQFPPFDWWWMSVECYRIKCFQVCVRMCLMRVIMCICEPCASSRTPCTCVSSLLSSCFCESLTAVVQSCVSLRLVMALNDAEAELLAVLTSAAAAEFCLSSLFLLPLFSTSYSLLLLSLLCGACFNLFMVLHVSHSCATTSPNPRGLASKSALAAAALCMWKLWSRVQPESFCVTRTEI